MFSSSQSASVNLFQDILHVLHGRVKMGGIKRHRLHIMFFNLAQVVGLQSFIDPNPNDASAFWGAKHIPLPDIRPLGRNQAILSQSATGDPSFVIDMMAYYHRLTSRHLSFYDMAQIYHISKIIIGI